MSWFKCYCTKENVDMFLKLQMIIHVHSTFSFFQSIFRPKRGNVKTYFLAGGSMLWIHVSIYAFWMIRSLGPGQTSSSASIYRHVKPIFEHV